MPGQKLQHTGEQTDDPVSGCPEPRPPPWGPALSPLLRAGFHNPSNRTLKLPTTCAFGGPNTIKSGPSSPPGLNWLRSKVTSFILCKVAEWDLMTHHKWEGLGGGVESVEMAMGHSGKRGRTGQIRDLIHQTDNGATMTKELEAVAGALRERKSILNFKQSPPQGKPPASLSQSAPLISSTGSQKLKRPSLISGGWVLCFCVL